MSSPADIPSQQYYKEFNAPHMEALRLQLRDDYRSRGRQRCCIHLLRLLGFACLMSGISYGIVREHFDYERMGELSLSILQRLEKIDNCPPPPQQEHLNHERILKQLEKINNCPPANCPPPPQPSTPSTSTCPSIPTAGLTVDQVVKLMNWGDDFEKVKVYDGALYLVRNNKTTRD